MERKLFNSLINTNENVEFFSKLIDKTEQQLYRNVETYIKNFLEYYEEPLDTIHSECMVHYDGTDLWLSCIDLNDKGEVVISLADSTLTKEMDVPLYNFNASQTIILYRGISMVIEGVLTREMK